MLIKLAVSAVCFLTCSYGLLNCGHPDAHKVTVIFNFTSVHACKYAEEKLEGCIINYVFDKGLHVYFVPTSYMIITYMHIFRAYNRTPPPGLFEEPKRMYQDCAEITDLIVMQPDPNAEKESFDKVLDHFKTAFNSSMPEGKIPKIMVPPAEAENQEEENPSSNTVDDNYYQFDYNAVSRLTLLPIYNVSMCDISVLYQGETYFVHPNMSISFCHPETKTIHFLTCSNTSEPEENLLCIDFNEKHITDVELAINESRLGQEIANNQNPFASYLKLRELWEPQVSCMRTIAIMEQKGWKLKSKECFAPEDNDDNFELLEIPNDEDDFKLQEIHDDVPEQSWKQRSTDL